MGLGREQHPQSIPSAACTSEYDAKDSDHDGLFNSEEHDIGTDPDAPDTAGEGVWDGEEVFVFGTNPRDTDTDDGGMSDRADPLPRSATAVPATEYAVLSQNADGTARTQLSATRMHENHVVQGPNDAGYLLYQTYLADVNLDGEFNESDLSASAIAVMNLDGTRPGMLTDYDAFGFRIDNGWIDVTPHGWQLQASPLSVAPLFRRQLDASARAWIFRSFMRRSLARHFL